MKRQPPIAIELPAIPPYRLLHVPAGEFLMGSAEDDKEAESNEKPAHRVWVDEFFIGEFAVTQDLWEEVMGNNPSGFKGPRRPVESVSWNDIQDDFLPALEKKTGQKYRLPTEAEWEYAAHGGPYWETEPYRYAGSDLLKQVGWYAENGGGETHDVGLLLPNPLGLYDMSGNVWEWCWDRYGGGSGYYKTCAKQGLVCNPQGPEKGGGRVYRGGGYFTLAQSCRSAFRSSFGPADRNGNLGFRLVWSPQSVG